MRSPLVILVFLAAACSDDEALPIDAAPDAAIVDAAPDAAIDAAAACAGTRLGGACWYRGAIGESCTTVCAAHGAVDPVTVSFAGAPAAGDRSNQAHCQAVAAALSTLAFTAQVDNVNQTNDYGCVEEPDKNRTELISVAATVAGSAHVMLRRFCACTQ